MDNILTAEVMATISQLLTLFVAGIPIALLTAIVVQIGKWVGLFESYGPFAVRRVAVIHSMLLGALWIGLQFYPTYVPVVTIIILGLYGSIMGAFLHEKVWAKVAKALGWDFTTKQFNKSRDKATMTDKEFKDYYALGDTPTSGEGTPSVEVEEKAKVESVPVDTTMKDTDPTRMPFPPASP